MNDEQLVEEHARKFAAQFQGFLKACEIIGKTGALGQLADEAQKRYDDIAGKADELEGKHKAARQSATQAEAALSQASAQAAVIKRIAATDADNIRAEAIKTLEDARAIISSERASMLESAKAVAAKLIADTRASLEEATAKVTSQRDALAALNNAIVTRQSYLDQINQDIAEIGKKFQAN